MADISVIIEVLGNKEIERATKSMSSLEGRVDTLRKSLKQGRISEDQFNQGLKEIRRSVDSQFPSWQKAKAAIDNYRKSLDRMEQSKAVEQATQDYRRLAAAIDPVERITQEYQRSVRTLDNALENNVITLDEYNRRLATVKGNMEKAGVTFNQYGQVANVNTRRLKRFSAVGLQQVGYQLGDFAVQVQSGTNIAVAFGQQMSQLLGIFGPAGAIAGAAVAIGTAFVAPLIDARKQAKGLQEDIENLEKSLQKQVLGFGSEKQLDTYQRILTVNAEIAEQEERKESATGRNKRAIEGVILRLKEERSELQDILENYKLAEQRLDRIKENQERSNQELEVANSLTKDFSEKAEKIRKSYESLSEDIGEAAAQALVLSGIDLSSGIDSATKAAAQLAAKLGVSVQRAKQIREMGVLGAQGEQMPGGVGGPGGPFKVFQGTEDPLGKSGTIVNEGMFKDSGTSDGGGVSAAEKQAREFENARNALAGLVSQYDEGVERAERLRDAQITVNEAINAGVISADQGQQVMSDYIDSLKDAENPMQKIADTMRSSLGDAFMSIVDGSKSAGDAFKDMARLVLKQAFELLVIKPILDSLFGGGSGGGGGNFLTALFSANGNAFEQGGKVTAYANGGVVNQPTGFQHSGGLGVMGEAGPEAIMPLKRGKNGKLGVQVEGGSQQPIVINQSFNFSANGDDSVKRIIAQEAPKIANLTQKQILDQRARGGAFKTTFG